MTDTTLEILISATVHCPVCNKSVTRANLTPAQAQLQPLAVAELVLAGQENQWGRVGTIFVHVACVKPVASSGPRREIS